MAHGTRHLTPFYLFNLAIQYPASVHQKVVPVGTCGPLPLGTIVMTLVLRIRSLGQDPSSVIQSPSARLWFRARPRGSSISLVPFPPQLGALRPQVWRTEPCLLAGHDAARCQEGPRRDARRLLLSPLERGWHGLGDAPACLKCRVMCSRQVKAGSAHL